MIICSCNDIRDSDLRIFKISDNKSKEIFKQLNKHPKCGMCWSYIKKLLESED